MSAATPFAATACLVTLIGLTSYAAGAHAEPGKSERALHKPKGAPPPKSENHMPAKGDAAGSPPSSAERAMPASDKK